MNNNNIHEQILNALFSNFSIMKYSWIIKKIPPQETVEMTPLDATSKAPCKYFRWPIEHTAEFLELCSILHTHCTSALNIQALAYRCVWLTLSRQCALMVLISCPWIAVLVSDILDLYVGIVLHVPRDTAQVVAAVLHGAVTEFDLTRMRCWKVVYRRPHNTKRSMGSCRHRGPISNAVCRPSVSIPFPGFKWRWHSIHWLEAFDMVNLVLCSNNKIVRSIVDLVSITVDRKQSVSYKHRLWWFEEDFKCIRKPTRIRWIYVSLFRHTIVLLYWN